jgi:lipopolysaccharide transport system permease protein
LTLATESPAVPTSVTAAHPSASILLARLRELIRYRDLIRNLVVSEVKRRYKNSVLGFVWSLLNPLAMMLVFTVVFGVLWPNQQVENSFLPLWSAASIAWSAMAT